MDGKSLGSEKAVVSYALNILDNDSKYRGVLLCEGVFGGIDVNLYQEVYPDLLVIPTGGIDESIQHIADIRKRMYDYKVYAIIDKDARSKQEVKELQKDGIYVTKLPYIENVISVPEIIRVVAPLSGRNAEDVIERVQNMLFAHMYRKIRELLPINVPFSPEAEKSAVVTVEITSDSGGSAKKVVDKSSIIYAYKSKNTANETGFALGLKGRQMYYDFFIKCLKNPEYNECLLELVKKFLPVIGDEEEKGVASEQISSVKENAEMENKEKNTRKI